MTNWTPARCSPSEPSTTFTSACSGSRQRWPRRPPDTFSPVPPRDALGSGRGRRRVKGVQIRQLRARDGASYHAAMSLRVMGPGLGGQVRSRSSWRWSGCWAAAVTMAEVLANPERQFTLCGPVLHHETFNWEAVFAGYVAQVDFPGAAFWPDLARGVPPTPWLSSRTASHRCLVPERIVDHLPARQRPRIIPVPRRVARTIRRPVR